MELDEALAKVKSLESEVDELKTSVSRLEAKRDELISESRGRLARAQEAEDKVKELEQRLAVASSTETEAIKLLQSRLSEFETKLTQAQKAAEAEKLAREQAEVEAIALEEINSTGKVHNPRRLLQLAKLEMGVQTVKRNALGDGLDAVLNSGESVPLHKLLESAQKTMPELFKAPSPGLGQAPTQPGGVVSKTGAKGWKEMNGAERMKLYKENPERAKQLAREAGIKI